MPTQWAEPKEKTMEYMILINSDENRETPVPGTPEFNEWMAPWMAYNQLLIDGGHFISGASLQPTATATTVSIAPGMKATITDGPYIETKEQLGGFYLITATDLDQALELAAQVPVGEGSIEVRPVAFNPKAG